MVPIFINVRDRVSDLRLLVEWLEWSGEERIVLLDNDSSWGPCLEYLASSPHEVIQFGANLGAKSLWSAGLVPDEPFVFTDPDIIPIQECPPDVTGYLQVLLERHPQVLKAGLGLYLDDVPLDFYNLGGERELVACDREIEPRVFDSYIDTTFALYRPQAPFSYHALRCGFPYQARHSSWYIKEPDEENQHYLARALPGPDGSSWAQQGVI